MPWHPIARRATAVIDANRRARYFVGLTIVSGFVRADRFAEVEGCPLIDPAAAVIDEQACGACPYNVLKPGAARIGCLLNTSFRAYEKALAHVERVAGAEQRAQLERALQGQPDQGLPMEALPALAALGERAWDLVGNDPELRDAIACLRLFAEGGLRLGEPVQLFSSFNISFNARGGR